MIRPLFPYCPRRAVLRMSWHPLNLFNMATKRKPFRDRPKTMFQQRWFAKREMRAFFGSHMTERQFAETWGSLPVPVFHRAVADPRAPERLSIYGSYPDPGTEEFSVPRPASGNANTLPPAQSLTMVAFERRLDIALFRACMASSVYVAKTLVTLGCVNVNGVTCYMPSFALADGDIVSVKPKALENLVPSADGAQDVALKDDDGECGGGGGGEALKTPPAAAAAAVALDSPESEELELLKKIGPAPELYKEDDHGNLVSDAEDGTLEESWNSEFGFEPLPYQQPWMFIPEYLEVDFSLCSFTFLRSPMLKPGVCEIPNPFPPAVHALLHEYYSNPKVRKKRGRERRPLNDAEFLEKSQRELTVPLEKNETAATSNAPILEIIH